VTLLGVLGILLGLLAWPYAVIDRTRARAVVFALAFLAHALSAIVFWLYTQTNASDASLYYMDPYNMMENGFGLSTQFVVWIVQIIKGVVGGTYLDYFLLFQAVGFFGLAILMRIMEEIFLEMDTPQPRLSYALLFLPGLHFWTSAIGKDAPLFTAICLAIWASMQLSRRFIPLGIAIAIMILVRPYIALVAMVALAVMFIGNKRIHVALRLVLGAVAIVGAVLAATTVQSAFNIDVTNADSVSEFLARREALIENVDASGNTAVNAALPLRILSLLFRPLFFDAQGWFAYIASLESVVALVAVGYLLLHLRSSIRLSRAAPFLRFGMTLTIGVTFLLGLTYFNVGLGLRQRTMIMPGLLVLVIALRAVRAVHLETHVVQAARVVGTVGRPRIEPRPAE
jgi:hypothetical protein